jgi:hypothetical protein
VLGRHGPVVLRLVGDSRCPVRVIIAAMLKHPAIRSPLSAISVPAGRFGMPP